MAKRSRRKSKKQNAARRQAAGTAPRRTGEARFAQPPAGLTGQGSGRPAAAVQVRPQAAPMQSGQAPTRADGGRQAPVQTGRQAGVQMHLSNEHSRMQPPARPVTARPAGGSKGGRRLSRSARLRKIVRRKQRRYTLMRVTAVALGLVCSLLALCVFFTIDAIEFRGMTRYTADEVLAVFGVEQGDNLFLCDSFRGAGRIKEAFPYFEKVRITRTLPDKLIINVTETAAAASVQSTTGAWYFIDKTGRVLEQVNDDRAREVAQVIGLNTPGAAPGDPLPADGEGRLEALYAIMKSMEEKDMTGKVSMYNMTDLSRIWIGYDERFAVCLGKAEDLDRKLGTLLALTQGDQFSPSDRGTIDVSGTLTYADMSLTEQEVAQAVRGQYSAAARSAGESAVVRGNAEDSTGETGQESGSEEE